MRPACPPAGPHYEVHRRILFGCRSTATSNRAVVLRETVESPQQALQTSSVCPKYPQQYAPNEPAFWLAGSRSQLVLRRSRRFALPDWPNVLSRRSLVLRCHRLSSTVRSCVGFLPFYVGIVE